MKGLRLRDVRPEDRETVLEFCRNTWPGYGDFIPMAWDLWVGQRRGRFIVAELDHVPVGIAKITDFGRGEIWLEGLRVNPAHRGKGIAAAINDEVARTLGRMNPGNVRFCTAQTNRASRRIGVKYGFEIVARFRNYWARGRRGVPKGEVADTTRVRAIYDFMMQSRYMKLSSGLVAQGWIFREFSRRLLRSYIKDRQVMVLEKAGEIRGVGIYPPDGYDECVDLGFVDGDDRAVTTLTRNCFYLAKTRGVPFCSASVPNRHFPGLVEQAGFKRRESLGQVVFGRPGPEIRHPRSGRSQ